MEISISVGFVESSMVETITYFWEEWNKQTLLDYPNNVKGVLNVTFKNAARYKYRDIPLFDVLQILASESVGAAFHDTIVKKGYKYEKISLSQTKEAESGLV